MIFFNRAIEGDGEEGTVLGAHDNISFIGTDAPEAGHMQGKMIGDYLIANYDAVDLNGDGSIPAVSSVSPTKYSVLVGCFVILSDVISPLKSLSSM